MLLSEHEYCVAITFKMTERVEQWICTKFSIKLERSSTETIQMIQKPAAMGIWWLAASLGKYAHSCITSHVEFFGKTSNHPGDSAPLQPRLGTQWLGFSQNYNHLWKGRDFRHLIRFRKIWQGSCWQLGELREVPKCLLEGDGGVIVLCTMFLVSSSINVSLFHITWLETLSGETSYILWPFFFIQCECMNWLQFTYLVTS